MPKTKPVNGPLKGAKEEKKTFIFSIALVLGVLTMSFLAASLIFAWTEPVQAPPGGNVAVSLNTSISAQSKEGALVVGSNIGPGSSNPEITTALVVPSGRVGIGTTSPDSALHVSGTQAAGLARFYFKGNNDAVPKLAFDFQPTTSGWQYSGGNIHVHNSAGGISLRLSSHDLSYFAGSVAIGTTEGIAGHMLVVRGATNDSTAFGLRVNNLAGTGLMVVRNDGRVGVGTTTPQDKLHVAEGNMRVSNATTHFVVNPSEGYTRLWNYDGSLWTYLAFGGPGASAFSDLGVGNLVAHGNVGVGGITSPTVALDVQGYVKGRTGLCIGDDCRTSWPEGGGTGLPSGVLGQTLRHDGTNWAADSLLFHDIANSRIGIGTTIPGSRLHVSVPSGITLLAAQVQNLQNAANAQGLLVNTARTASDAYVLNVQSGGTSRLYVRSDGNVGINITSPGYRLDVSGTGRFTGALTLGTQASAVGHAVRADRTISTGTGLSGGGNLTADRTISADTAYLQRRVSGTCATDEAIRVVNADGTVSCVAVGGGGGGGTTVTYDIPVGNLINQGSSCNVTNYYNNCGAGQPGFTWTSTGSGSIVDLSIEVNVGVDCHSAGYSVSTALNGTASGNFSSINWCSCTNRNNVYTLSPPLASYNVGGSNTFLMTNPANCLGQCVNTTWPEGTYARVTVTYSEGDNGGASPGWEVIAVGTPSGSGGTGLTFSGITNEWAAFKLIIVLQTNLGGDITMRVQNDADSWGAGTYRYRRITYGPGYINNDDFTGGDDWVIGRVVLTGGGVHSTTECFFSPFGLNLGGSCRGASGEMFTYDTFFHTTNLGNYLKAIRINWPGNGTATNRVVLLGLRK